MDPADGMFLGMVGINVWSFIGLNGAALLGAFVAAISGTAGGLILLALMAMVFPPALLIPVHTIVQLGAAASLGISRWRYMMWDMLLPFVIGTAIGAAVGGRIFIGLSESVLLFILGVSILILCWVPKIAQFGPEKGRFVFVGFVVAVAVLARRFVDERRRVATVDAARHGRALRRRVDWWAEQ